MEKPSLDTAKAGAMRFNTDSSQMEIYDGNQWTGILATSPEIQTGGTRGLRLGGNTVDVIDYFNIDTTGNAIDFGNLTGSRGATGQGFASRVRGFQAGGYNSGYKNNIDFFIIPTTGNASDFGDLLSTEKWFQGCSDAHGGLAQ